MVSVFWVQSCPGLLLDWSRHLPSAVSVVAQAPVFSLVVSLLGPAVCTPWGMLCCHASFLLVSVPCPAAAQRLSPPLEISAFPVLHHIFQAEPTSAPTRCRIEFHVTIAATGLPRLSYVPHHHHCQVLL